jgi:Zn-dependent protease
MSPDFTLIILGYVAFLIALTTHEFAHALVGYLQGDETARRFGRLTPNPIAHIDPIGTILMPLLGSFSGLPFIGWAKPVPFNPYNLKHGKWGAVAVAIAGPGMNLLVAFLAMGLFFVAVGPMGLTSDNLLSIFLLRLVIISLGLGVFNLLPVPPLDGSRLITSFFDGPQYARLRHTVETKGPLFLLGLVFLDYFLNGRLIGPIFNAVFTAFFGLFGLK